MPQAWILDPPFVLFACALSPLAPSRALNAPRVPQVVNLDSDEEDGDDGGGRKQKEGGGGAAAVPEKARQTFDDWVSLALPLP